MADNFYDSISSGYNELHGEEQLKKLRIIKEKLKPRSNQKLLDVGCGTCLSWPIFNCVMTGIEPSGALVEQSDAGADVVVDGAENLLKYFSRDYFDFVICVTVAHHFSDPEKVFSDLIKVGKNSCVYGFSLLKKSANFAELARLIRGNFSVSEEIDEAKDLILICKKK